MELVKGRLPLGCELCAKGAKIVLFVTGACGKGCFYCPISFKRRVDKAFANERPVKKVEDIIEEAARMKALGAGVTGGNPLIDLKRTCSYITALKESFGQKFHIHIYVPEADRKELAMLNNAGVDEIRFHWGDPKAAMLYSWKVGGEVPAVPGWHDRTVDFIRLLESRGADFLNLNELDISEGNAEALKRMGFHVKNPLSYAISGSEELALKLLNLDSTVSLHYCSSAFKDAVQLRMRYVRTAKNIAKPYEKATEDGTIVTGAIEKRVKIKEPHHFAGKETRCAPSVARKYAKKWPCKIVEWIPTWDGEVREVTRL